MKSRWKRQKVVRKSQVRKKQLEKITRLSRKQKLDRKHEQVKKIAKNKEKEWKLDRRKEQVERVSRLDSWRVRELQKEP